MHNSFDVIVIGGGPAGSSAAAFAARCRWKTLIIDRSADHGYLGSLGYVSYFPGFPEAISGQDLLKRMRRQAELVGAQFVTDVVRAVSIQTAPFKVLTDGGREFEAPAIVLATGAAGRTNYMHGERELLGRGVSHDAVADGPAFAKRAVAVVGKSRHSAQEAIALSRFAEKVHLIVPSNKLEADDALQSQLQKHRNIEINFSTSLKKINGTDHVTSITVFLGGQEKDIPVAGVFSYIHEYQPSTGFLEKMLDMSPTGAVKVDDRFATSADGVFACGDVLCGRPQFPAIAAAQGLVAGISADRHLSAGE